MREKWMSKCVKMSMEINIAVQLNDRLGRVPSKPSYARITWIENSLLDVLHIPPADYNL